MNFLNRLAKATLEQQGQVDRRFLDLAGSSDAMASMYLDDMHGVRAPAEDVFASNENLLIIGMAGAGKTTLLRARSQWQARVFLDPDKPPTAHARAPLYILAARLRNQLSTPRLFIQALADYCAHHLGAPTDTQELERYFGDGSIELLVDGLDELGFAWNETAAEVSDLFRRIPKLRGIVSSRPAALTVNFTNFTSYTIADLDLAQIRNIIATLPVAERDSAKRFIEELERLPQLASIARSPLLLRIMLMQFGETGHLPQNRALLFSTVIELLLRRWDGKRVRRLVDLREVYSVLAAAAATMFETSQTTINAQTLDAIVRAAHNDGNVTSHELAFDILSNGLFIEVGDRIFGFVHKTFAEYFTALAYRDDLAKLTSLLSHENGGPILEFASDMIENPAFLVEKAVSRGQLVLAARMVTSGRYDNKPLQTYVAQAFRQALEPNFIELLVESTKRAGSKQEGPQERAGAVSANNPPMPDKETRPAEIEATVDAVAVDRGQEPSTSERLLKLLDGVRDEDLPNEQRGKLFETFAVELFGRVFKVADTNYLTDRGEIDLILELEPGGLYWSGFGNEALVECKNLRKKSNYDQAATFITKVAQSRRRLGFIVSYLGFTQDALWAIHDNAADRDAPLIIAITGEDIRKSLQLSEAPGEFFKKTYRSVTIPRRGRRRPKPKMTGESD